MGAADFFATLPVLPDPRWFIRFIIKVSNPSDDKWVNHLEVFIRTSNPEIPVLDTTAQVFVWWRQEYFDELPGGKLRRSLDELLQRSLQAEGWMVGKLKEENRFHQLQLLCERQRSEIRQVFSPA
jgi:hypothetical protein